MDLAIARFTYSFVATGTTTELVFTDNSTNVGQTDLQLLTVYASGTKRSLSLKIGDGAFIGTAAGIRSRWDPRSGL